MRKGAFFMPWNTNRVLRDAKVAAVLTVIVFIGGPVSGDVTEDLATLRSALRSEVERCRDEVALTHPNRLDPSVMATCSRDDDDAIRDLVSSIGSLRYLRHYRLIEVEPLGDAVLDQVVAVTAHVNQLLQEHGLPVASHSPAELKDQLLAISSHAAPDSVLNPYFRAPLTASFEVTLRRQIEERIRSLAAARAFSLSGSSEVAMADREALNRRFSYQIVRDLIGRSMTVYVDGEIEKHVGDFRAIIDRDNRRRALVDVSPAASEAPRHDVGDFDRARTAFERLYGIVLSLLPVLADDQESTSSHGYDVSVLIESHFPPYTQVRAAVSTAVHDCWWLLLFGHFESNDGNYLGEDKLHGKLFAFDRDDQQLYLYDKRTEEFKAIYERGRNPVTRGVYLLSDYGFGDLWSAQNAAHLLDSVRRRIGPNGDLLETPTVLGSDLARAFGGVADGSHYLGVPIPNTVTVEWGGEQRIRLASVAASAHGRTLSEVDLPPIALEYRIATGANAVSHGISLPVQDELFHGGAVLRCSPSHDQTRTTVLDAPGRIRVSSAISRVDRPFRARGPTQGITGAIECAKWISNTNSALRLSEVAQIISKDPDGAEPDVDLALLQYLGTAGDIPRSVKSMINDLTIGQLLALNRRDEALAVLRLQATLMQTHADGSYVDAYFRYYRQLLKRLRPDAVSPTRAECSYTLALNQVSAPAELQPVPETEPVGANGIFRSLRNGAAVEDGPMGGQPRDVDVRRRLLAEVLATDESTPVHEYLTGQVLQLFEAFPNYAIVDTTTADDIIEHWQRKVPQIVQGKKSTRQFGPAAVLIWETYHRLLAFWEPLTSGAEVRKSDQVGQLVNVVKGVLKETQDWEVLCDTGKEAIEDEVERSVSRLKEYTSSAFIPYMYYPLDDRDFVIVLDDVTSRLKRDLITKRAELDNRHREGVERELGRLRSGADVDMFQARWRRLVPLHTRPLVSLLLGDIVRQYGMIARRIDYKDAKTFPLFRVKGMGVGYSMQSGLSTELHLDWVATDLQRSGLPTMSVPRK